MKQLGDILRELREDRDLKQKDVADALFISNKILSSYERNISQPPIDMLKRICEYYQVSADMLLGISPAVSVSQPSLSTPSASYAELCAEDRKVLSYYNRLNSENREAIRGLMICYYRDQEFKKSQNTDQK